MIRDGSEIVPGAELRAELCVIGTGPAGLTVAETCAAAGLDVLVLESGGADDGAAAGALTVGESGGDPYFPVASTRVRAFGGSSAHWLPEIGLRARPLDPIDFEVRPEIPHSGWPFDRPHLEPWYRRAQALCRLGPWDYQAERWTAPDAPLLPLPPDLVRTVVFQFGPLGTFRDRLAAVARAERLVVLLGATALELVTDGEPGRIEQVRACRPGGEFTVGADRFVLAAGGLENPRLLLLSRGAHPRGLGNEHDLVGRFFMEHLGVDAGVWWPTDPAWLARAGLYAMRNAAGTRVWCKIAPSPEALRREGLLNSSFYVFPVSRSRLTPGARALVALKRARGLVPRPPETRGWARQLTADVPGALRFAAQRLSSAPPAAFRLEAMSEQAPNPQSRVTLGTTLDPHGQPAARLEWRTGELDRRSIRGAQGLLDEALRRAGLGRLEGRLGEEHPPAVFNGQWHHLGTTRMHVDPRQGVVDADGRVHGVRNLYLAGGSVFPTGGYANPTLTIVALALRLADHLVARRRR